MARKNQSLVLGHLEGISRRAFKNFHDEITELVKGQNGLYALYSADRLYYVGLARDLKSRLKRHLNDHHKDDWDYFSFYITNGDAHLKEMESLLLRIITTKGNRVRGKLKGSDDKRAEFDRRMKEAQRRERQGVYRKPESRKERKSNRPNASPLRGHAANGAVFLRAQYKGKEYRATLSKDGTVRVGTKRFSSLSAAGTSITKRATNGRYFWRVRNAANEWVRISTLGS